MPKLTIATGIAIAIGLLAGLVVAALFIDRSETIEREMSDFDSTAGIDDRLRALESAVSIERQARQLLEEELQALYAEVEARENSGQTNDSQPTIVGPVETVVDQRKMRDIANSSHRNSMERRLHALTEAGFSAARADWIVQRESEMRMDAMQARYELIRSGVPVNPMTAALNTDVMLRDEIGDAQFEMYLRAGNRPTAVGIAAVLESSPAQAAGLLPGDEVTHYNGTRVFSTFDLTRQTMEGNAGENVVVNITRDGMPMQVVMPRGPLGVNTGRRR